LSPSPAAQRGFKAQNQARDIRPLTLAVIKNMDAFIAHHGRESSFPELRALAATSVPIVYRKSWRQEAAEPRKPWHAKR
jgi:hypothetical protein